MKKILKLSFVIIWTLFLALTILAQHEHSHEILDSNNIVISSSEGICFRYNPYLAWNLGLSDLIIFLCYFFIPLGMFQSLNSLPRGLAKPLRNYAILLGLFIVTCGLTHLVKVFLLFNDIWHTAVIVNWICALSSTVAAIYLWFYARTTLNSIASNLKDLVSVRDSLNRLNELEAIVDSQVSNDLTTESMKAQINLIRLNLNTLKTFQDSIQDSVDK